MDKAEQILLRRGLVKAEEKAGRIASDGLVESYIHHGGRIGAMVELNCETDFVARTEEFKDLAHNIAMQVAATGPRFILQEEIPEGDDSDPEEVCLLHQQYIKQPEKTVKDIITETIAKVGENIRVKRFARFELGC